MEKLKHKHKVRKKDKTRIQSTSEKKEKESACLEPVSEDQPLTGNDNIEHSHIPSIQNPQLAVGSWQLAVGNQQSQIHNPQSQIGIGLIISIGLTAALGLAISIYLTIHHYRIMSGLPEYQSFCSISEYIDCDMVNSSSYSEFNGLPVALFGAGIYAFIVSLIILSVFTGGIILRRYVSAITILGLVSFCFSIYFAVISTFVLHTICILCVATYFINLFIFLGSGTAACKADKMVSGLVKAVVIPFGPASELESTATGNTLGIFTIIMIVIQGFFASLYLDAKYLGFTEDDIASFKEKYLSIEPQTADLADSPYWGSNDPDLTIVVFEDFLCNFCRRSHVAAFPIFKEYKDRIKIVFKYLPYDKDCNPSLQKTIHPGACKSSIAAACASLQGKFLRFQGYFFDHQGVIKPDMDIIKVAADIGEIDMDAFKSCLERGRGEWLVRRDFAEAMKLGVNRTPAYFFNGRKWEGALKPVFIKKILEWELNAKD